MPPPRPLRSPLLGLLLAVAPSLGAQSPRDTVPTGFVQRAGGTRHWIPAHFAPAHAQTTYDSSVVALPTGNLTRLWLRPDEDPASGPNGAQRLLVSVALGSDGVPAPSHLLPTSYAANRGRDHALVLDRATVDFPASTPDGSLPPFAVSLPLRPFPFVAGRNLQVEWDLADPGGGTLTAPWFVDAVDFTKRDGGGWFRRTNERDACPPQGTIHDGDVGGPGELASVWFYSLAGPDLPAVMWFGLSDTQWNGTPLPIDLTGYGQPGCAVWTDLSLGVDVRTDASGALGRVRVDLRIPFDPGLNGFEMFAQTFVFDPSFGGGLRASDRGTLHVGNFVGRLEARHLYSYQGAIDDRPEFAVDRAPVLGLR